MSLLNSAQRLSECPPRSSSDIAPQTRVPHHSPHFSPSPRIDQIAPMSMSPFQDLLDSADLPSPGPDYYDARRALWWLPGPNLPSAAEVNQSRIRLETLLAQPSAVEDDEVWDAGIDRVWGRLVAGARLKDRLPLGLVTRVLQAGWIREGTWPRGAVVPDSDDPSSPEAEEPFMSPSILTPASMEERTR